MREFQIAGGSIPGRDHMGRGDLLLGKNNQDSFLWAHDDSSLVAIVSDGCGGAPYSEVGSRIGARLLVNAIRSLDLILAKAEDQTQAEAAAATILKRAGDEVRAQIRTLASQMAGDNQNWFEAVKDYFLFTVLGTLITDAWTTVFALGDGIVVLNGEVTELGPFPGNKPPYLAYGIADQSQGQLAVLRTIPTASLESLLLGTDGAQDLNRLADRALPGQQELVGPITQFWTEDKFFTNSDAVRRRLSLANREVKAVDKLTRQLKTDYGLLRDDTTLVAVRRVKSEKGAE